LKTGCRAQIFARLGLARAWIFVPDRRVDRFVLHADGFEKRIAKNNDGGVQIEDKIRATKHENNQPKIYAQEGLDLEIISVARFESLPQ
jgi:hypothetical protein